ncbi:hypothetical protein ACPRNU_24145 [Chromobacterium vaccinii]|uniref:hypothetical protein n=1 Tax=Chromobacterium TaxID=535 RepID=UPI00130533BC|nr:hypothetical protein [Chromobacterium sp. ATCC 53434]
MKRILLMLAVVSLLGAQAAFAQASVSAAKNYGGIRVWASAARGSAGRPISVDVHYAGLSASGGAQVTYTTEGALTLSGPAQKTIAPNGKGGYDDTVVVQAASDGAYFLNVFATTAAGTSIISVPVTVGAAVYKPRSAAGVRASAPGGQRVIEMPAQETRR